MMRSTMTKHAPESGTFSEVLERWVSKSPTKISFTYLANGEDEEEHLTYAELAAEAHRIATAIKQHCELGDRVLLVFPPGLHFIKAFLGCMYAGVIAVPIYPPKARRTLDQFKAVLGDADPSLILTVTNFVKLDALAPDLPVCYVEALKPGVPASLPPVSISSSTIALLQYTSGSTGLPKGVMVSHGNILHNQQLITKAFGQDENAVVVGWLPFYHDMGLIGNILHPLFVGGRGVLMSPVHFLQKPIRWLNAISKYKATVSGGPNFAYDLCTEKISETVLKGVNLSSWKVAFNGAENVKADTLKRFEQEFEAAGFSSLAFQPCYGMAEATLYIASKRLGTKSKSTVFQLRDIQYLKADHERETDQKMELVSCGTPAPEMNLLLVDASGNVVPNGTTGQILIAGPSVNQGYWNRENQSRMAVPGRVVDYFATGDLGLIHEGELYIVGRLKDLIIVNGKNYYPTDIEALVTAQDDCLINNACAAFSIDHPEGEKLVLVAEVLEKQLSDPDALLQKIRSSVTNDYQIAPHAIALIRRASLPKTTSGKIQRTRCRQLWQKSELVIVAESHASEPQPQDIPTVEKRHHLLQERVMECVSAIMRNVAVEVNDNLFALGMNSIAVAQLSMELSDEFEIEIPLEWLLEHPSVGEIASYLQETLQNKQPEEDKIHPVLPQPFFPLSSTQYGIWFDQKLKEQSNSYHVPVRIPLPKNIDIERFKTCFSAVLTKHEIFRTTFRLEQNVPVQVVAAKGHHELPLVDKMGLSVSKYQAWLSAEVCLPFDLENGPLYRAQLIKRDVDRMDLLFVAHHLITDGTSIINLLKQLFSQYEDGDTAASTPQAVAIQFRDIACWEQELSPESQEHARAYWHEKMQPAPETLKLPYDRGIGYQGQVGASRGVVLQVELMESLKQLARSTSLSVYAVLLSGFKLLMHQLSGQESISIGAPVSARTKGQMQQMIGPFLNAVILSDQLDHSKSVHAWMQQVGETLRGALKHQNYPLHLLAKELDLPREVGHFPVTSVFFNGLNFIDEAWGPEAFGTFQGNLGLEMNLDLNCYVIESQNDIQIRLDYQQALFRPETIDRLLKNYVLILELMSADPQANIGAITQGISKLPNAVERKTILDFAIGGLVALPEHTTVLSLIEEQVRLYPQKKMMFQGDQTMTLETLNGKANYLAEELQAMGVSEGDFVPLLLDKTLEFPVSILAILKLNAAFIPMSNTWPQKRIEALLQGIQPKVVLVTDHAQFSGEFPAYTSQLSAIGTRAENFCLEPKPESPMYGFYTSGTTGLPKCTINLHKGILNRFLHLKRSYGIQSDDCVLFTSSHLFDPSVWQMLWPLANGIPVVFPETKNGIDFEEILTLIDRYKVSITDFVPSVLHLLVDYLETNKNGLKQVSSLRQLTVGGEAMNPEYIGKLKKQIPGIGITNTYGATEVSIATVFYEVGKVVPIPIPIGKPAENTIACILNDKLELLPIGVQGEIYLGGDVCLGSGYMNDQEKTDNAFIPNPIADLPTEKLYKTGDLGFVDAAGNLHFMGREDEQVKINGMRVEIGEIEQFILSHPQVQQAAVTLTKTSDKVHRLMAHVAASDLKESTLTRYLNDRLPGYMVPQLIRLQDALPLTNNGKVDKKQLEKAALEIQQGDEVRLDQYSMNEGLEVMVAQLLGIVAVSPETNFFEAGGDSLKAMQLLTRIQKGMGLMVSLREIFEHPRLKDLGELIAAKASEDIQPIKRQPIQPYYEINHGQRGLWLLQEMDAHATAYNMPGAFILKGPVEREVLNQAFQMLIQRHEILRTTFHLVEGVPMQKVQELSAFTLEYLNLGSHVNPDVQLEERINELVSRPFVLSEAPLLRAALISQAEQRHALVIVIHHIISDAWSMEVLWRQVIELYEKPLNDPTFRLEPLPMQNKDITAWMLQELESSRLEEQRRYWMHKLEGEPATLKLPTDNPREKNRSYAGKSLEVRLNDKLTAGWRNLTAKSGATIFMSFLAAIKVLMYRYSGQQDLILGTVVASRDRKELQDQIGFYVNTLPLRSKLDPKSSFETLLKVVKNTALEAYENQAYPFQKLVSDLQYPAQPGSHPLFNVLVVMLNTNLPRLGQRTSSLQVGELAVKRLALKQKTAKFDLTFNISDVDGEIAFEIEYDAQLFRDDRIERMADQLLELLVQVLNDPGCPVMDLNILPKKEKSKLLQAFNQTQFEGELTGHVFELFDKQVIKSLDQPALYVHDHMLTYRDLRERVAQLAAVLQHERGVKPGDYVAIMMPRNEELLIAVLAVLQCGASYIPIDRNYPMERVRFIAENSGMRCLIAPGDIEIEKLPQELKILDPVAINTSTSEEVFDHELVNYDANQPLVLIYTSGSTGQPKGVCVMHNNLVNLLNWGIRTKEPEDVRCVLASTSVSFDISLFELFFPLVTGNAILMVENLLELAHHPCREKVTFLNSVPSVVQAYLLLHRIPENVRTMHIAGEPLTAELANSIYDQSSIHTLMNMYGPTEASVYCTGGTVFKGQDVFVTIGKPLDNTRVYILDAQKQLLPIGVIGEIFVGGKCLTKGYLGNEQMNRERFVENEHHHSGLLYRTGDLGYWTPEGEIVYVGRLDDQVKIRGHRIEPGEIQNQLIAHPSIREAAVTVVDQQGEKALSAYITLHARQQLNRTEINAYMREKVPGFMVPQYVMFLDEFPHTTSGKVDKRALPSPILKACEIVAPNGTIEVWMHGVWAEVLALEKNEFGVTDDFFVVGGHSLKAIQIVSRIESEYGFRLSMEHVFSKTTIKALAKEIERELWLKSAVEPDSESRTQITI